MPNPATPTAHPNRLREIREAAEEKPEELALALDVGRITIDRWETGRARIPAKHLHVIATRYRVSIDYLLCNGDHGPEKAAA